MTERLSLEHEQKIRDMLNVAGGREWWTLDRADLADAIRQLLDEVDHLRERAEKAEAERDAVYRERAHLVAHTAVHYPTGYMPDLETGFGWRIVYVKLPTGQCSWHISPDDWHDLFAHLDIPVGTRWDGHTTEEKYRRIREHTVQCAAEVAAYVSLERRPF